MYNAMPSTRVSTAKVPKVPSALVHRALNLLAPKDKRTLIEMCANGLADQRPAQLLITRTATLLQRELIRHSLDVALDAKSHGTEYAQSALGLGLFKVHFNYW